MTLAERLQADLKTSMLAKDEKRTAGLRLIRAEILRLEKEEVGRVLDDATVLGVLATMVKQRRDSIAQFAAASRTDLVAKEEAELDVILPYLPAGLTDEEISAHMEAVIASTGAAGPQDMGKVIGPLMKALKATGKSFEGNKVNALVKARLG